MQDDDAKRRDEVLKRMLNTKPETAKEMADRKRDKKLGKKALKRGQK